MLWEGLRQLQGHGSRLALLSFKNTPSTEDPCSLCVQAMAQSTQRLLHLLHHNISNQDRSDLAKYDLMDGCSVMVDIRAQTARHWPKTLRCVLTDFVIFLLPQGVTKTLPWQDIHFISKHAKQWAIQMMETLSMNPLFGLINHCEHMLQMLLHINKAS